MDNKKKSLKGLESAVAPSDEVNVIQNEITEINQEIEEMQKKKKDDLNQSVAQLDKEIEKKNEAITDIKKGIKNKITNNKQAIVRENKNKENELARINEQITSNQNVKNDVTMFKEVVIRDKIFNRVVTRHQYDTSNLSRPSSESCYAYKPKRGGQQLLELAIRNKFGKVESLYDVNNDYGLNQGQWANYTSNCKWF